MRQLIIFIFMIACCGPAWSGELEGLLTVEQPSRASGTPPPGAKPFVKKPAKLDLSQAVIFIDRPAKRSKAKAVIHQRKRRFLPFVTVIQAGGTIAFPNDDVIYHSVYSESPARVFQLEEYPQGESRDVTFNDPGHVELYCAIHTRMNAHILVLDNQMFVRPDKDGKFRLAGLKPGNYRVTAWHPLWGEQTLTVVLKKKDNPPVSLTLTKGAKATP